ncbi:MAG: hypothetical protein CM1200mP16_16790 [Nitrospina sp.]|nr:MAG: hypothetical protein CM1200mP16_16790 [Nitrospina sp.]
MKKKDLQKPSPWLIPGTHGINTKMFEYSIPTDQECVLRMAVLTKLSQASTDWKT